MLLDVMESLDFTHSHSQIYLCSVTLLTRVVLASNSDKVVFFTQCFVINQDFVICREIIEREEYALAFGLGDTPLL